MTAKKPSKIVGEQLIVNLDVLAPYEPTPDAAPRFLTPVYVRLERDDTKTLLADVHYESAVTGKTYVVPAGFNTDFASVPRLPLAFLLTGGVGDRAAVIHDYLYRKGIEDRATCDKVFAEALEATGVAAWRRGLMWAGVRVGGRSAHKQTSPETTVPAAEPAKAASTIDLIAPGD